MRASRQARQTLTHVYTAVICEVFSTLRNEHSVSYRRPHTEAQFRAPQDRACRGVVQHGAKVDHLRPSIRPGELWRVHACTREEKERLGKAMRPTSGTLSFCGWLR